MDIKSERLASALRDSGLTQIELCKRTGITAGALSSYLSGRYYPKQRTLERLADALGVSVLYLMGFDDASQEASGYSDVTSDEARLLSMYRSLNPVGKKRALQELDDLTQIERYIKNSDSNSEAV
ncbi:MAG: helix-turn-helix domain-containing protein [Eubacterium sp.]|nr:helix-turn-helix domain-containing protein [Eubacterium sp.]MBQ4458002.1 helix-turn-helix domain-containing protein [Clostridia bacterium]